MQLNIEEVYNKFVEDHKFTPEEVLESINKSLNSISKEEISQAIIDMDLILGNK